METVAFVVGPLLSIYVAPPALVAIFLATITRSKRPLWLALVLACLTTVAYRVYWSAFGVEWDRLDAGHRPRVRVETAGTLALYGCAAAVVALTALATLTVVRRLEGRPAPTRA